MEKKIIQNIFDFIFDAPSFSEFLPNKDMNYYNPLENKINEKNELDNWFLQYHEDHYGKKEDKQKGKKSNNDLSEKGKYPSQRSKGDLLPKTRKRKQISTDEYQQALQVSQSQQIPQKQNNKPIRRLTNVAITKQNDKTNTLSNQRRYSKDLSLNKTTQIVPILERTNAQTNIQKQVQDKRVTRSKSNSKDILAREASNKPKRFTKTDEIVQKIIKIKDQKMIPEIEEKIVSNSPEQTQERKMNLQIENNSDNINDKGDVETINQDMRVVNNLLSNKLQGGKIETEDMNKSSSKIVEKVQTNNQNDSSGILKENKVVLSQNNSNQIYNAYLLQNKSIQKTNQDVTNITMLKEEKVIPNQTQRRSQIDKKEIINNLFNKVEFNNNQQFINSPKHFIQQNIQDNVLGFTPILQTDKQNSNVIQTNQKANHIIDENINFNTKSQGRIRQNKHRLSTDSNDENQQKHQRHKSLNFSLQRKSGLFNQSVASNVNKRKSEMSSLLRGRSIEEQSSSEKKKLFEKDWEKRNGVKMYMLDYQKRKEIRQLFQEKNQ